MSIAKYSDEELLDGNITATQEEIEAWMRERLLKLSSLLKIVGGGLGTKKGQNEDELKIMAQGRAFGTTKLEMK